EKTYYVNELQALNQAERAFGHEHGTPEDQGPVRTRWLENLARSRVLRQILTAPLPTSREIDPIDQLLVDNPVSSTLPEALKTQRDDLHTLSITGEAAISAITTADNKTQAIKDARAINQQILAGATKLQKEATAHKPQDASITTLLQEIVTILEQVA